MNDPTLRQLRYLDELAKHRHFGRAADACAISQPALSTQIKELEAGLGVSLVERTSRQVELTALGEEVVERARAILASIDELTDMARLARDNVGRGLRLGIIPTVAPYLLPAISSVLAEGEGGGLRPREAKTQSLIDDLLSYRLDVAIAALPVSEPALEEVELFEEEFVLVRHESEAGDPIPSPRYLEEMRLLLLEEGHCLRDQALSVCDFGAGRTSEILEGSSLSTLVQMVGAGIGLTLIPEIALALEMRSSHVAVSRFTKDIPTRRVGMVWRRTHPRAEQFRELKAPFVEAHRRVLSV
ncbi:MAG: LysR substrate-binding domain-containing protein [Pseudomonadota bacterium]